MPCGPRRVESWRGWSTSVHLQKWRRPRRQTDDENRKLAARRLVPRYKQGLPEEESAFIEMNRWLANR
jgi:hypothetical protein